MTSHENTYYKLNDQVEWEAKNNRLPKAELHLHLRESMSTELVQRLAQKHNVEIPLDRIRGNEFVWHDFYDFLALHQALKPVSRSPEDYAMAAENYLVWSASKGVIYVELRASYSPEQTGIGYIDQIEGMVQGIKAAKEQTGIESRIIVSAIRQHSVEAAERAARMALQHPHPYVTGFDLTGDEPNFPPGPFRRAFDIAAEAGLSCTAHAGEWCGPDRIWATLELANIRRLGHGVRAVEDPKLIEALIERDIALEVCPSSNVALGVFPSMRHHTFGQLFEAGVKVTISTDDPPYFKTSMAREYRRVAEAFQLTIEDQLKITRNAIEAAFIDEPTRQELLQKIDDFDY